MIIHIGVSDSDGDDMTFSHTQNDKPRISPSQPTMTTDDGENQQELDNVYSTTTIIEYLPTEDTGIKLLKLTWRDELVYIRVCIWDNSVRLKTLREA